MAILDLLRRRRQDQDEEEEDVDETEDADEDPEDEPAGGGLLGRLKVFGGLGGVFRRGGRHDDDGDDDGDDDAEGDEAGDDEAQEVESRGGLLSRFRVVSSLRGILKRGGDGDDEDEEEDDEGLPVAVAPPQVPEAEPNDGATEAEPEEGGNPEGPTGEVAPAGQPAPGTEEAPQEGEAESATKEAEVEISPAARRLRELARSQEDVPIEELTDDLNELLDLLGGRRR